ncbi:MAG: immunity 22 family protein [Deltaproteobacteria bacterium]|nr:immunity 22 family protein [Deltaproteobacteria bacterium]
MRLYWSESWVSIWIGMPPSQEALDRYVEEHYGLGRPPSQFAVEFGVDFYDSDFRDTLFSQQALDAGTFLSRGFSYWESFVDLVRAAEPERQGTNNGTALIALYDVRYGLGADTPRKSHGFRFVGAFPYVKDVSAA